MGFNTGTKANKAAEMKKSMATNPVTQSQWNAGIQTRSSAGRAMLAIMMLLSLLASTAAGQSADSNSDASQLRDKLEQYEKQLSSAEKQQQKSQLRALLDADLVYVASNGMVFSKQNILEKIAYLNLNRYNFDNVKIRRIGENGVLLTYDLRINEKVAGHKVPQKQYASSVWVKDGGQWKLLFHQGTPANH
jgi:hypothetical protein